MSWFKTGDKMTINGAVVTHNKKGWNTTYGMTEVSEGMTECRIKVEKCKDNWMFIGIASNTNNANGGFVGKEGGYALRGEDGKLYSKDKSDGVPYARYGEGDTVTVTLNMDKGTMSFTINERECGTAFTDIPTNMKYRIAVGTYDAQDKFEMISDTNVSNEEREEKKENENELIMDQSKVKEMAKDYDNIKQESVKLKQERQANQTKINDLEKKNKHLQNESENFVKKHSEEIEKWKKTSETEKDNFKKLSEKLKNERDGFEAKNNEIADQLAQEKELSEKLNAEMKTQSNESEQLKIDLRDLREQIQRTENEHKQSNESNKAQNDELEQELARLKKIQINLSNELTEKTASKDSEIQTLTRKHDEIIKQLKEKLNQEMKTQTNESEKVKMDLGDLRQKIERTENEHKKANESNKAQTDALEEQLARLKKLKIHLSNELSEKTAAKDTEIQALTDKHDETIKQLKEDFAEDYKSQVSALDAKLDSVLDSGESDVNVLQLKNQYLQGDIQRLNGVLKEIENDRIPSLKHIQLFVNDMHIFVQNKNDNDTEEIAVKMGNLAEDLENVIKDIENNIANGVTNTKTPLRPFETVKLLNQFDDIQEQTTTMIEANDAGKKNQILEKCKNVYKKSKRTAANGQSAFANVAIWTGSYLSDNYPLVTQCLLLYVTVINAINNYIDNEECSVKYQIIRWLVLAFLMTYLTFIGYKSSIFRHSISRFMRSFGMNYILFILMLMIQISLPPMTCYMSETFDEKNIELIGFVLMGIIGVLIVVSQSAMYKYVCVNYLSANVHFSKQLIVDEYDGNNECKLDVFPSVDISEKHIKGVQYISDENGIKIIAVNIDNEWLVGTLETNAIHREFGDKLMGNITSVIDTIENAEEKMNNTYALLSQDMEETDVCEEKDENETEEEQKSSDKIVRDSRETSLTKTILFDEGEYVCASLIFYKRDINKNILGIIGIKFSTNLNETYVIGQDNTYKNTDTSVFVFCKAQTPPNGNNYGLCQMHCKIDLDGYVVGIQSKYSKIKKLVAMGNDAKELEMEMHIINAEQ